MKAAIEHLNQRSWYVVYRDNSLSLAIAQKGVGKLKPLSGRLLWLQQRQGRETMTALLTDAALSRATIEVEAGQRNPEEQPSSLATAARATGAGTLGQIICIMAFVTLLLCICVVILLRALWKLSEKLGQRRDSWDLLRATLSNQTGRRSGYWERSTDEEYDRVILTQWNANRGAWNSWKVHQGNQSAASSEGGSSEGWTKAMCKRSPRKRERRGMKQEATEAPTFVNDQGYIREAHVRMIRASREEDEESERV